MARHVAITGVGLTPTTSPGRQERSRTELGQEAAWGALEHAALAPGDLDGVVVGNIDNFEGTNLGAKHLTRLLGLGAELPVVIVNTGGTTGGNLVHVAARMVRSGDHERVLCLGPATFDGARDLQHVINTNSPMVVEQPLGMGAVHMGAFFPSAYQERFGIGDEALAQVAVRDHANAERNPYAHLRRPLALEDVVGSRELSSPLTLGMVCPVSSGACAVVVAAEDQTRATDRPAARIRAVGSSSDPYLGGGRGDFATFENLAILARRVYRLAGIADPRAEIDVAEVFSPYAPMQPMQLEALGFCAFGEGPELIRSGAADQDGDIPTNLSGGPKCTNPGVSGELAPYAHVALQLMGAAPARQVPGARVGLAHGTGGTFFQFNTMAILERS